MIAIICVFALVAIVRSFFLKPSDKTRISAIPEGEYDPAVWGRYHPPQYGSIQKNLQMPASTIDFGRSVNFQPPLTQPQILTNFTAMAFSKDSM